MNTFELLTIIKSHYLVLTKIKERILFSYVDENKKTI